MKTRELRVTCYVYLRVGVFRYVYIYMCACNTYEPKPQATRLETTVSSEH